MVHTGNAGTCYTTLTDNKTFTFAAGCLSENQMVWGVASTLKRLPKETVKLIHDHAVSLGFKRDFFLLDFDTTPAIWTVRTEVVYATLLMRKVAIEIEI